MSKQDSESDVNVDETQHQENSYTPETLQNNTTVHDKNDLIHDEYDTSENENTIEIETIEDYGEKIRETEESIPTETSQVFTVFNKTIHHEDDSSDDKSVIEIESPEENREQEIGKQDKLLTTTFRIEIENRKVKGLITYSTDQQIFKFKVNSWGVNIEFTLYELKCTIHAILQHMGFYHTTENPCVMMTEFRQPLQVQIHLEMPRILVQLGHTHRTWKLAPQTDPKWSPTRSSTRYQDQISVTCTRWTLRMQSFTRAPHAQPSLSNFTRRDSDFGEPTHSRGTTRLERNFPSSPQNKKTKLTHRSLYMSLRTISTPHVN